ncbi:hypothetical protein B7494_g4872 [Chlorociboria aeruginascens]|nr:hypothetical protein B7494_g4872 [Chlorociboria aeruginascens]
MEYQTALLSPFDPLKPSLFELLSSQQLSSLLPPSLRYFLVVLTHRSPRYLLPVLNSFDELYALLHLLLERYFLYTHGGGFVENFYGLKRERSLPAGEIPRALIATPDLVRETLKLSHKDIWRNLVVVVGIPYVKRKLDEGYEINAPRALLGGNYTRLPLNANFRERIRHYYRWFLQHIYPSVNSAYSFSRLAFNILYLFDNTKSHDPFLWLIGTRVRRLNSADYAAIEALSSPSTSSTSGARRGNLGITSILNPRILLNTFLNSFKFLLPTSIFALKFLEWWYASDFARQLARKATEGIQLPPPIISGLSSSLPPKPGMVSSKTASPKRETETHKGTLTNPPISSTTLLPILTVSPFPAAESANCPICKHEVVTPTACQTGLVYCYTCIHRWMNGEHEVQERFMREAGRRGRWEDGRGRCAVTGRRVLGGTEGLRRVII